MLAGSIFWLKDSRQIVYQDEHNLCLLDSQTKKLQIIAALDPEMRTFISTPSRDNRWLYYTRWSQESDIWLMLLK